MDGRTREARYLRTARERLTAELGGAPTATQTALIERASMLMLHVAQLDAKALATGGRMTEHDQAAYLAWSNSLTRALRDLGLQAAANG